MASRLIVAPEETPIDVDYVKDKLRVDFDDDDVMLEAYIAAATDYFDGPEGFLKRALIDQTWDFYLDEFPDGDEIALPLAPVIEISGLFYLDGDGNEQEFDVSGYDVDIAADPPRVIVPTSGAWPTAGDHLNSVRIRFRAGYLDTGVSPNVENVPGVIKLAILMRVKADYDAGDNAEKLREIADNMVRLKYRRHTSLA